MRLPAAAPLTAAVAAGLGVLALRWRDPHVQGSWGVCPFSLVSGLDCPGCGSLRAMHHLAHGDLAAAASSNLLLVLALPFVLLGWWRWAQGRPLVVGSGRWLLPLVAGVLAVGFAVLRNLPAGSWLAA